MTLEEIIKEVFNDTSLHDPEEHTKKLAECIRREFCIKEHYYVNLYGTIFCRYCGVEKPE